VDDDRQFTTEFIGFGDAHRGIDRQLDVDMLLNNVKSHDAA
jgi:hypothetical protein